MNPLRVTHLLCTNAYPPIGIDTPPIFRWQPQSETPGRMQTAARVRVSRVSVQDPPTGVWDSGWMETPHTSVRYGGTALEPRTRYQWQVSIRTQDGATAESEPAAFETGKMSEPWAGRWISAPDLRTDRTDQGTRLYRTTFTPDHEPAAARLYICGLGLYTAWIEGRRVGDLHLEPAYTKYDARAHYRTYDVTDLIAGDTPMALAVEVGNGFYNMYTEDAWQGP